jgi:hypothetical protein
MKMKTILLLLATLATLNNAIAGVYDDDHSGSHIDPRTGNRISNLDAYSEPSNTYRRPVQSPSDTNGQSRSYNNGLTSGQYQINNNGLIIHKD